jgi:hypothetical protein
MRKKITDAVVGTLLASLASFGCDPGPADTPPAEGTSVEIDSTTEAHTSSDAVTKWKFQNRSRDGIITGKSADGKERFHARMAIMPNFQTSVLIVTKPSVLVLSITHLTSGDYEMAPSPDEASAIPNPKTMAYLKQLQGDIAHHKHGFDGAGCDTAAIAAGFAWAKVGLTVLKCAAGLEMGNTIDCSQAVIEASAAGAATGAIAASCGWFDDMRQSFKDMDAAIDECMGFFPQYGTAFGCNT